MPIAVEQPAAVSNSLIGAELPLDVGPAPDQGDVRAVHPTLGPGRRVWASIQDSWEVKFKQVCFESGVGSVGVMLHVLCVSSQRALFVSSSSTCAKGRRQHTRMSQQREGVAPTPSQQRRCCCCWYSCMHRLPQVLRQQGLDYNTWKHEQDQHYSTFHKDLHVSYDMSAAAIRQQSFCQDGVRHNTMPRAVQ